MIREITVEAAPRAERGKNAARRLRRQGQIPAVLYGEGKEAVPLQVNARQIGQILRSSTGHNTIIQIAVGGGSSESAMLVDWQTDPVRGHLLHTDLKRLDLSKKLRVKVPIIPQGDAKGVKVQGGLLEIVTREVEVECLPTDIPAHITVDVSELMVGESIRAGDLAATGAYLVVSDPDRVLVHVIVLKEEEEPKPAEAVEGAVAAAPAEPEVIKKGKQVDEEVPAEEPKEGKGKK